MTQLSNNLCTHVVMMKDGGNKFVNKKVYDIIWRAFINGEKRLALGEWVVSMDKISELISVEEFKSRYPQKFEKIAPAPKLKTAEEILADQPLGIDGIINMHKDNAQALEQMIIGVKRSIGNATEQEKPSAYALLKKMETKLALAQTHEA